MADPAKSIFRSVMRDASQGLVLKPLLHSYLFEAEWPEDFAIHFKKGSNSRPPDAWFHPSAHPLWPERMLWFYLTQPDGMIPESLAYMNTLSVTMGTALHGFMETCLRHIGILLGPDRLKELGFVVDAKGEPGVVDELRRSRGHMDGVLEVFLPSRPDLPYHLFEFKTSNEMKLSKVKDLDLDAFILTWPEYYAQVQEYLRMSGLGVCIILFMQMGFPWSLKEFHIPANPQFQHDTASKYLRVTEAAASGVMPPPCCGPRSKESRSCPARAVCPVGLA